MCDKCVTFCKGQKCEVCASCDKCCMAHGCATRRKGINVLNFLCENALSYDGYSGNPCYVSGSVVLRVLWLGCLGPLQGLALAALEPEIVRKM